MKFAKKRNRFMFPWGGCAFTVEETGLCHLESFLLFILLIPQSSLSSFCRVFLPLSSFCRFINFLVFCFCLHPPVVHASITSFIFPDDLQLIFSYTLILVCTFSFSLLFPFSLFFILILFYFRCCSLSVQLLFLVFCPLTFLLCSFFYPSCLPISLSLSLVFLHLFSSLLPFHSAHFFLSSFCLNFSHCLRFLYPLFSFFLF